jgi:hypothetical protein
LSPLGAGVLALPMCVGARRGLRWRGAQSLVGKRPLVRRASPMHNRHAERATTILNLDRPALTCHAPCVSASEKARRLWIRFENPHGNYL